MFRYECKIEFKQRCRFIACVMDFTQNLSDFTHDQHKFFCLSFTFSRVQVQCIFENVK